MNAEEFVKKHFKGLEDESMYIPIVAIAEGYAKYYHELKVNKSNESIDMYIQDQENHIIERTPERMASIKVVAHWCKKTIK